MTGWESGARATQRSRRVAYDVDPEAIELAESVADIGPQLGAVASGDAKTIIISAKPGLFYGIAECPALDDFQLGTSMGSVAAGLIPPEVANQTQGPGSAWRSFARKRAFPGETTGFDPENAKSHGKSRDRDARFAMPDDASVHLTLQ